MAWSDASRQAAVEARRRNAKGKKPTAGMTAAQKKEYWAKVGKSRSDAALRARSPKGKAAYASKQIKAFFGLKK